MIYFDHAATTKIDARVLAKMEPFLKENYGNPSSIYSFAQIARQAMEEARSVTARILECKPREVIFTGSGTESNNLAIFGIAEQYRAQGNHIVATAIEHDSILKPLEELQKRGFEVTLVKVGENGVVNPEDIVKALQPDTILVSVMYANNEIGTIQPIAEISRKLRKFNEKFMNSGTGRKVFFHTDACQAAPYLDLSVKELGVDLMTLNGGKIYGPKGIGVLYVREGVHLKPQIFGGGQEFGLRSGTENVPDIVGFAEALKLAQEEKQTSMQKILPLREKLIDGILKSIPDSRLNGHRAKRLPNNINISFRGLEGEGILLKLDEVGIAASAGSACTTGSLEPSHVIRALGLSEEWTHGALRLTLGKDNTDQEVNFFLKSLLGIIDGLRESSPFF